MPFPLNPFMGCTSFYRCLLRGTRFIAAPIKALTRKSFGEAELAFEEKKQRFSTAHVSKPSDHHFRLMNLSSDVSSFFSPCPSCTQSKNPASYHPASIVRYLLCPLHLHLGDFAYALIQNDFQPFIHTFTHRWRSQPSRATTTGSSGCSQGKVSCSGTPLHSARRSRGST